MAMSDPPWNWVLQSRSNSQITMVSANNLKTLSQNYPTELLPNS